MADATTCHGHRGSARLGLGCSNLGSDLGYRDSCALVASAYEAGIRHFDVAPSYGHGDAERILGDALQGVRDQVCIVTKVGIAHPRGARHLRTIKRLLAPVKAKLPGLWARGAQRARQASAPRGQFGATQIRASLEESLRRLRTEHVDWVLLHSVLREELTTETLTVLTEAVTAGLTKGFGLATSVAETAAICAMHPGVFGVRQVNHFWGAFTPQLHGAGQLNTHRVIREGMDLVGGAAFQEWLQDDAAWTELATALQRKDELPQLLLAASLCTDGIACVLVGTSKPARIKAYAQLAAANTVHARARQLNAALVAYWQYLSRANAPPAAA